MVSMVPEILTEKSYIFTFMYTFISMYEVIHVEISHVKNKPKRKSKDHRLAEDGEGICRGFDCLKKELTLSKPFSINTCQIPPVAKIHLL